MKITIKAFSSVLLPLAMCSLLIMSRNQAVHYSVAFLYGIQKWFFWLCTWEIISSMCVYRVEISGRKKTEVQERLSQKYWPYAKQQTFYVVWLHFFCLSQSYQVRMQATGLRSKTHWSHQKDSVLKLSDDDAEVNYLNLYRTISNFVG